MWYLISTLNKDIFKKLLFWICISLIAMSLLICLFEFIDLTKKNLKHSLPFELLLQMSLLKLPNLLDSLLPSICFFASLLCFLQMHNQNFFIIINSFGISRLQFLIGASVCILFIGLINLFLIEPVRAVTYSRLIFLEEKFLQKTQSSISLNSDGLWLKQKHKNESSIIHVKNYNINEMKFENFTMFNFKDNNFNIRIDAKKVFLKNGYWLCDNAFFLQNNKTFSKNNFRIPTSITIDELKKSTAPAQSLSFLNIPDFISTMEKSGVNTTSYKMAFYSKISKIGLMISVCFLAASFCFLPSRQRSYLKVVAASIVFAFLIHFISNICYAYGMNETLPIQIACWSPCVFALMCTYWLFIVIDSR